MRNVLIDTDILIDFLRGRGYARDLMLSLLNDATVHCSAITIAEIYAGMREHEREKTEELLNSLNMVEVSRAIAEKAGNYKRTIKGHRLELDDCIIAATAFIIRATLCTGNARHYPMTDIDKKAVKAVE